MCLVPRAAIVWLCLCLGTAASAEDIVFLPLGDLEGGEVRSRALGLSADGSVVVGDGTSTASGSNGREALRWDAASGSQELGTLPGGQFFSIAWAASAHGEVIVGESSSAASGANASEAFVWRADDGALTALGDLPGGAYRSVAHGVSAAGDVIVGASSSAATGSNGEEAFLWRQGDATLRALGSLAGGSTFSTAFGVSGDGEVVVGEASSAQSGANEREAFRWTDAGGMAPLGDLPGGRFASRANATSRDGSVVVGASSSAASGTALVEAFRWTETEGLQPLGALPGGLYTSEALALSGDGSVIVGTSGTLSGDAAFYWDPVSGMRSLFDLIEQGGVDLGTWRLTAATGVSDDGTVVVGTGIDPAGQEQGWVVVLPEPAVSLQAGAALAVLALLRRRRSLCGVERSLQAR